MIQICNDEYWEFMTFLMPLEAPCGETFEDIDQSTICPHRFLP